MIRRLLALLAVIGVVVLMAPPVSAQGEDGVLTFTATVDERDVAGAGSGDPVRLDPRSQTELALEITNPTDQDVVVRRVRLFGEMMSLTLVAYDVTVELPVDAGETESLLIPIEFVDLDRQATGLLRGGLSLFGEDRELLARQEFVMDVRGSVNSVVGLFGIFVAVATGLAIVGIALAVSRRTLGPNRVRRGARFAFVGLGIGLTLVISLAAFRIVALSGSVWLPMLVIPSAFGFALGYVSPGALAIEEDEIDEAAKELARQSQG